MCVRGGGEKSSELREEAVFVTPRQKDIRDVEAGVMWMMEKWWERGVVEIVRESE